MANGNRKPYESATVLDQDFLDAAHDNLANQLEMIVDIDTPAGVIHVSDRNKFVGDTFYEARLNFPTIKRTIGELLSPEIEFSNLTLELNNVDGKFNNILPAGADYGGWIGKSVEVKIGLRDVASTYKSIFKGTVTNEGGFARSTIKITLVARNDFDRLNVDFPKNVFTKDSYPDLPDDLVNIVVPIIYGDWTVNVETGMASVPAFAVNSGNANVNGDTGNTVNVQFLIADHALFYFDPSQVYLKRGDLVVLFDTGDVVNVGGDNRSFELRQTDTVPPSTTTVDGNPFKYARGDTFYVKVKGKDLGAYSNNIVAQAKDILLTFGGAISGDFDTTWDTYRDKATPAESAVGTYLSRVWLEEPQSTIKFVLSMLEQVRLEAFVDRNLKLKISSLHFDDFVVSPTFNVRNWDIEEGSFSPKIDEKNNINRVRGVFNYLPNRKENFQATSIYRNAAAITQAGQEISKKIVFPNLYDEATVALQVQELLKLTSGYLENVEVNLTWRGLLLDIGDFVRINVNIEGTIFENVPALIREIGYDPQGIKIPMRLFSFQLVPFRTWNPGFSGITGGSTATITAET